MTEYELAIDADKADAGYAALAYRDDESGSYVVNGVALGPDDVTKGMSGKRTRWPAEVLEEATELLVGAPITAGQFDELHPGAEKGPDGLSVDAEAPDDATIGHVTKARWSDALGLLWQGDIDDEAVADGVERGDVDVSPVISRDIEPVEGEDGLWEATAIHGFRDLTALPPNVPGAAPSNSIEPGESAQMAEALAEAFDESAESDADADAGGDLPPSGSDDPTVRASTGGADGNTDTNDTTQLMSDENISDKEAELLAQVRQADEPVVVEKEDAERLTDADELLAAADAVDGEAKVVSADKNEALSGYVERIEGMLDEALVEHRGLRENTVEAMSFDAKASEFENDEGDLDAEALVMTPETGDDQSDDADDGVDALSDDEREDVEALVSMARRMDRHAPDFADEKRREAAEALALDPDDASLDDIEEAI